MSTHKDNFAFQVGQRLELERKRLGMTQEAIAAHAGVSRVMWGKYVKGESVPGGDVLVALAHIGTNVAWLLGVEKSSSAAANSGSPLTTKEVALLDNYRHSDETGKAALDRTSAALAKSPDMKRSA